jgi:hypothetical protein
VYELTRKQTCEVVRDVSRHRGRGGRLKEKRGRGKWEDDTSEVVRRVDVQL